MPSQLDFETIRAGLEDKLNKCFTRPEDPDKRFAPSGKTREILDSGRLERLFLSLSPSRHSSHEDESIEERLQSTIKKIRGEPGTSHPGCCNILATLLCARCRPQTMRTFEQYLYDTEKKDLLNDDKLPFEKSRCDDLFGGSDGYGFWESQMPFCPIIFKENDQVNYVNTAVVSRLPWVEEPELLGEGSYGVVWKGTIEIGHLINKNNETPTTRKAYAIKQFRNFDSKAMETEGAIVQQIVQATKKHENILVTRASLARADSYYLIFDLAKYDLWEFFDDAEVPAPRTFQQRMSLLNCFTGLASGLAYLHDELYISLHDKSQRIRCYHLDLKPQNILVFFEDGRMILRLTDFGISRIKKIQDASLNDDSDHPDHLLDKIFHKRDRTTEPSSGVRNSRFGGTYSAPEALDEHGKVTRKSDVWGFGTILTLAMTYMQAGREGIADFEDTRSQDRDDHFFDKDTSVNGKATYKLHSSVEMQLEQLTVRAASKMEGVMFKSVSDLLKTKILCPQGDDRVHARQVEASLRSIHSACSGNSNALAEASQQGSLCSPATLTITQGLSQEYSKPSHMLSQQAGVLATARNVSADDIHQEQVQPSSSTATQGAKRATGRIATISPSEARPRSMNISLRFPRAIKICRLSPSAKHLAVGDEKLITIVPVSEVLSAQPHVPSTDWSPPEGCRWTDFSSSAEYLCVGVDSNYFQFSIIPLASDTAFDQHTASRTAESPIHKLAVSADATFIAFVLRHKRQNDETLHLAIYRTQDVIPTLPSRGTPISEQSNFGAPETSRLPRSMGKSRDLALPTGTNVLDMKFSKDNSVLILVTRPYRQNRRLQYDIYTWDLVQGKRLAQFIDTEENITDPINTWHPIAFCPFPTSPKYAITSRRRIRTGDYLPPSDDWAARSEPLPDSEIMEIIVPEGEQHLVVLGRTASAGEVKAFEIPTKDVHGLKSIASRGVEIGIDDYRAETDACHVYVDAESGRHVLLIARLGGEGRVCSLSRMYLTGGERSRGR